MVDAETLALLAEEAEFEQGELRPAFARFAQERENPAFLLESLERLAEAATSLGLSRVQLLKKWIAENLLAIAGGRAKELGSGLIEELLNGWLDALILLCRNPGDPDARERFHLIATLPDWPLALSEKRLNAILADFCEIRVADTDASADSPVVTSPSATAAESNAEASEILAHAGGEVAIQGEDHPPPLESTADSEQEPAVDSTIDLSPSAATDPGLWEAYLTETPGLAAGLVELIRGCQGFLEGQASYDAERLAHTVKGSSSLVGIAPIHQLGLHLEEVFERLRRQRPDPELAQLFEDAADILEIQFGELGNAEAPAYADPTPLIARLEAWENRLGPLDEEEPESEGEDFGERATDESPSDFGAELLEQTPTAALLDFIDLSAPATTDPRLWEAYLSETPGLAAKLVEMIRTRQGYLEGAESYDAERLSHTVKGSSSLVGINPIYHLAYHLEEVFERLRRQRPDPELAQLFEDAADILEIQFGELGNAEAPAYADPAPTVARLEAWEDRLGPLEDLEPEESGDEFDDADSGAPVNLAPPSTIDPRLWEAYLSETPGLAGKLIQMIRSRQGFVAGKETHEGERLAHTIKGSSSLVGIPPLQQFGLHLEEVFERLQGKRPEPELAQLLEDCADVLELQFSELGNAEAPGYTDPTPLIGRLTDWEERLGPVAPYYEMEDEGEFGVDLDDDEAAPPARARAPAAHTRTSTALPRAGAAGWTSVQPAADVDERLLDAFFQETPDQAAELAFQLRSAEQGELVGPKVHETQRLAHTIKGSCALVGLADIERLAHRLEDVLELLGTESPPRELGSLFTEVGDAFESLFDAVIDRAGRVEIDSDDLIARLQPWVVRLGGEGEAPAPAPARARAHPSHTRTTTAIPRSGEPGWTSVQPAADLDDRLLDAFFQETPDQAAELALQLRSAAQGQLTGAKVHETQRLAHTVKGSCALVGLADIERLAHRLEDVLELLGTEAPPPELGSLFTEVGDAFESLFDAVIERAGKVQIDSDELIARLQPWVARLGGKAEEPDGGDGWLDDEEAEAGTAEPPAPAVSYDIAAEDLLWDETVAVSYLDTFFADAPEQGGRLASLLRAGQLHSASQRDEAASLAATLRKSAHAVGIAPLEETSKSLEKILESFAGDGPPPEWQERLTFGAQLIDDLLNAIQGISEAPPDLGSRVQRLAGWEQQLGGGDTGKSASRPLRPAKAAAAKAAPVPAPAPAKGEGGEEGKEATSSIRVPTQRIDALMRLVGEMTTAVAQMHGRLQQTVEMVARLHGQGVITRQRMVDLETLVGVRGIPAATQMGPAGGKADFDPLEMDHYHELHGVVSAFAESFADSHELARISEEQMQQLAAISHHQQRLSREINEAVLATRMFPLNVLTPRLERAVRESCRSSGKLAELQIDGDELLADTDIINGLRDGLMHILRNCVDHGIEMPDARRAKGKDESGLIQVRYQRQGNTILVRVIDDGGGFNVDRIRATAEKNGIKLDPAMGEAEILRLVLLPGFSTKGEVTRLSGRGVGMDVVRQAVEELKGSIILRNRSRAGAETVLRLPLTLVAAPVLLVKAQQQVFAIPGDDVDQILYPEPGSIGSVAEGWTFHHGDRYFPLRGLNALIGRMNEGDAIQQALRGGTVLLVHDDLGQQAILVDKAMERRDVVVQALGPWLPNVQGVSGACILADGSVSPVLDLRPLLREGTVIQQLERTAYSFGETSTFATGTMKEAPQTPPVEPAKVMVVDDSLSARKALEVVLDQAGFRVVSAIDGFDAIRVLDEEHPNLILTDMEMPRMNGLEFTQHVRAQPQTRGLPIVMVTSRSTAKHREQARRAGVDEYVTKPFDNAHLFGLINRLLASGGRREPAQ